MRVRQEADIEDEVGIVGNTLSVSETHGGDKDALAGRGRLEAFDDVGPQFVDGELGGVHDDVCLGADGREDLALELDGRFHGLLGAQRVRTASLTETANQSLVGSL